MKLTEQFIQGINLDGKVVDVRMGPLWTGVAVETERGLRGGLASTQVVHNLEHGRPAVKDAGRLLDMRGSDLAHLAVSTSLTERSLGFAALNALIEVDAERFIDVNAETLIIEQGTGKRVAIVGHFPFVPRVEKAASTCWVLELNPRASDLPAERAPDVLPEADVVAITGMSLVNGTFEPLAALCRQDAYVVVLGATTPLSPVLFDYGVNAVSGTIVTDITAAFTAVSQGANFRQIPGKRLVTLTR